MSELSSPPRKLLKLRTRVSLGFVVLAVLASGLTLFFVFTYFQQQLRESLRQRLVSIVSVAALQQDGDAFSTIQSADDLEYTRVWEQNTAILEADPDLVFVYTMRFDEQGLYFVVDAGDPNGPLFSNFGDRYESPGQTLADVYKTINTPVSEESFYQDEYGYFLSAYAPIQTSSGETVGIIAVDMSADKIIASERKLLWITLAIFAATLPVIAVVGWLLGNSIAAPIEGLTLATTRISQGDLNYRPTIRAGIPEIITLSNSFTSMADQLKNLVDSLEERVTARTADLSAASEQVQVRVSQLQTISEVAHSIALIQNLDELLRSLARLISDRFAFYHVGIFLLDSNEEYAILCAANSEGGQRMLERSHRLKVGEVGMVGFVAAVGNPRIALDVGADAVFFNNPDLPETRSEMALPLLIQEKTIGVLDLQSQEVAAFKEDDFEVFRTLADQVAIAIENARLLGETRRALEESEKSFSEVIRKGWQSVQKVNRTFGVRHTAQGTYSLSEHLDYPEIKTASEFNAPAIETQASSAIAIPLAIRGEIIGVLDIRFPEKRVLSKDDIQVLQRVADRAALAMENARLLEDAQQRAERERTVSQISTNIRSTTNPQLMVETAIDELKRVLGVDEIEIRPYSPTDSSSAGTHPPSLGNRRKQTGPLSNSSEKPI